jgi:hypothetical protein
MNLIISSLGTKYWRNSKGELHRIDGPVIETCDGVKVWYLNGKKHRSDGPTVEYPNGYKYKEWWINGQKIDCNDNEEFLRIVKMKELL